KEARCAIGGGTFSANPVTMTAGLATLNFLKKNSQVYSKIDRLGNMTRKGLSKIFADSGIACSVTGLNSIFMTHFGKKVVQDASDVATANKEQLTRYNLALMADDGIFFLPGKMGAFSYAHDEGDVKRMLAATEKIVQSGLFKQSS
ncbi:MAG TPA: aspartate aminotransferase family protein, partial [Nitrososphaera sp.]|nr:aspartate aminotransferase family protein [Nitrososphaera sp.]